MNANMAWHLMRAGEACDLTEAQWESYEAVFDKLPLGPYFEDVHDFKGNKPTKLVDML